MQLPGTSASLKTRLNLAIAAVFLAVSLGTLGVFALAARSILTDFAGRIAVKQALLERNRIYSVIERELTLARALALDPSVRRWVASEGNDAAKGRAMEQFENYRALFRDHSYFVAVDASKRYYIATQAPDGTVRTENAVLRRDVASDRWYFNTMDNVEDYALNLDFNTAIGAAKVWFNVIIRGEDGEKIGIGGGGVDITAFMRDIVAQADPDITVVVVDALGVIQAIADRAVMEHNAGVLDDAQKTKLQSLAGDRETAARLTKALSDLRERRLDVASFEAVYGGEKALAAVAAIPEIGWYNVVFVDASRVMGGKVLWPVAVLILASLLAVLACVTVVVGRLAVRPILSLTRAASEMASGNYAVNLDVARSDEIGQLTASFNRMARQVRDYTADLESEVVRRTLELTRTNEELSESRARIMESMRYARTIQFSLLPRQDELDAALLEHMEIYQPRDIVGGDLIYFRDFPDHFLIAALDCTGHGVPGALTAMTAHAVLSHVTSVICGDDPAVILRETDRALRETLDLAGSTSALDCGLEIALCCYKRVTDELVFAGAGLSLFVADGGQVREIKGDRKRLGFRQAYAGHEFATHVVSSAASLRFYAPTDGVLDEGGGEKGFAFGEKRFMAMIAARAGRPMSGLAGLLTAELDRYRGERSRRDDIAMIGFTPKPGVRRT